MKYKTEHNGCRCHPETCCCAPFKLVNEQEETLATFYNKEDAQKLIDLLEKK